RNVTGVQTCALPIFKKAREGVDVRLLYDDMGSRTLSRKYIRRLEAAGIKVGAFFPPKIPKLNLKINFRNHRKLAIIDGKIGYIRSEERRVGKEWRTL